MSRPRPQSPPTNQPRLLDQVRTTIRLRGKSSQTEKAYTDWIAVLRQNLIPTPNASHWSHITPVNMLYSNSQYENHSICKR
jgi:hypothetical protein